MIQLENIDSWIQQWDVFMNTWTSDCWEAILLKIDEDTNPCPSWNSIFSNSLSWSMVAWCHDWTETINFVSWTLLPENIKNGVDILWTVWTFTWFWGIPWANLSLPSWQLIGNIPAGNYVGTEIASISDTNLLDTNIKKNISIFWVTGTYEWELPPSPWQTQWYHTWYTFWEPQWLWSTYYQVVYETWLWAIADANNLYLCYSAKSSDNYQWYWVLYHKIMRYNSWVLTLISDFQSAWWTYYWQPTFFTSGNWVSGKIWVIYGRDDTLYFYDEIDIATWTKTTGHVIYQSSWVWSALPLSFNHAGFSYSPKLIKTNDTWTQNWLACNVNII